MVLALAGLAAVMVFAVFRSSVFSAASTVETSELASRPMSAAAETAAFKPHDSQHDAGSSTVTAWAGVDFRWRIFHGRAGSTCQY